MILTRDHYEALLYVEKTPDTRAISLCVSELQKEGFLKYNSDFSIRPYWLVGFTFKGLWALHVYKKMRTKKKHFINKVGLHSFQSWPFA